MKIQSLMAIWVLMSVGCIPVLKTSPSNHVINKSWQTADIQQEIATREQRPLTDQNNLFILALLHTHPNNQHPDYRAAINYLTRYLSAQEQDQSSPKRTVSMHSDWRAQYIHHLLTTITALEKKIGQSESQTEVLTWEQTDCQKKQAACSKKLKNIRWALKKSKKSTANAQAQLEEAQLLSMQSETEIGRLESENTKLKIQLKKLTDLYINLEKKRQAIQ